VRLHERQLRNDGVKRTTLRRSVILVGVTMLLAGCASHAPLDTWKPKGTAARDINNLQRPVFYIAGVVGVAVFAAVGMVIWKYREREGDTRLPHQSHGNQKVEIILTIAPAILLAGITIPTIATVFKLAKDPGPNALEVNVTGQQWWWEFSYPSIQTSLGRPLVTADEMVIPVGQKVKLVITSRDVIHSFWIPALNGKRDAVPNRFQPLWIEADHPGEYWGQCTEFCGLSHANMRMKVVALSAADFQTWMTNQQKPAVTPTDELAQTGQQTFIAQCSRCHEIEGLQDSTGKAVVAAPDQNLVSGAAPNLTHVMSRTTFAGSLFELQTPACQKARETGSGTDGWGQAYLAGTTAQCLNDEQLSAWIRDAPSQKPMYSDPNKTVDGKFRGMPALGLSEAQIDQLVAYLTTLK
jgi:cytochrome c oxidase subunit II